MVIWAKHEEHRVGEVARVPGHGLLGRTAPREPGEPPRVELFRHRPGSFEPLGQLDSPTLSRKQWDISRRAHTLCIKSIGKQRLLHNGVPQLDCAARAGDIVSVEGVVSFLVEERPQHELSASVATHAFGAADDMGIVGEHPLTWDFRRTIAHVGRSERHVLLLGASGVGKELAARGLHSVSSRAARPLLSRNAATIPASLVEAELFGHAANFPNAGMPSRPGLIGSADGTTLFLDEIGELDEAQQANLLRVLDAGEYQRLGEDRIRHSNFRLIAATNRAPSALKHDFLARFTQRIEVVDLNARRSDIPLLLRHLLGPSPHKPSQTLMERLTRHQYSSNVRELERLLQLALREGDQNASVLLTPQEETTLAAPRPELSAEEIQETLRTAPSLQAAALSLGLPSRYALYRLMKKWGIG